MQDPISHRISNDCIVVNRRIDQVPPHTSPGALHMRVHIADVEHRHPLPSGGEVPRVRGEVPRVRCAAVAQVWDALGRA